MKKIPALIIVSLMLLTVIFSAEITEGIKSAIDLCIYTLVPSLFPFLVLSKITILSGAARIMGRIIHPVTGRLFGLSENGSFLFLTGMICGYPIGAKCISDMVKDDKITLEEGERLILFCNNSGPLFVIGAVGYGIYSSTAYGILLYASHILSAIIIGILIRKSPTRSPSLPTKSKTPYFTKAVEESMIAVLNISGYVIFFSAICTMISGIIPEKLKLIKFTLSAFAEITQGIKKLSLTYSLTIHIKLILTSFLLGFGGVCVLFQTKSVIADSGISILPYLCSKICQGVLSAFITYLIISFYPLRSCAHIYQSHIDSKVIMLCISLSVMIVYIFKSIKKGNRNKNFEYK